MYINEAVKKPDVLAQIISAMWCKWFALILVRVLNTQEGSLLNFVSGPNDRMTSAHQSFESLQKIGLIENRRRHSDNNALSCHGAKFTSGEGSDCSEYESASSSTTESWADLSLDLHFLQASKGLR